MKLSIPCFSNLRTSALIIGYTELFFIGAMFTYNWNGISIRAVFDSEFFKANILLSCLIFVFLSIVLVIIMVSCWLYGIFEVSHMNIISIIFENVVKLHFNDGFSHNFINRKIASSCYHT